MRAQFDAFPALYFNIECRKHNASVETRIEPAKPSPGGPVVGAQLIPTRCHVGGAADRANCVNKWKAVISAGGPITIVQD